MLGVLAVRRGLCQKKHPENSVKQNIIVRKVKKYCYLSTLNLSDSNVIL